MFAEDQPTHRIAIGADRLQERPLLVDQGWILPAGAAGVCEFDAPLTFSSVAISGALLDEVGFHQSADFEPMIGALDPLLLEMVRTVSQFESSTSVLYRESLHRALAAHLVHQLEPRATEALVALGDKRLQRAIDYIHDNLGSNLSLQDMARQATLSPYHFARAFKQAIGLSPLQYVIKERLLWSRVLLSTTQLTVADIALRVGYDDLSRFRKHFKRQFGVTPAQARQH
ncbi:MAG: AraC family transcriptional regulator [Pseudomonadota bacterium]